MNNQTTLYSYANSWSNPVHSKKLDKTVKKTYLLKGLLLLIVFPLDIVYLLFLMLFNKKFRVFFATEKWPDLTNMTSKKAESASISSPVFIFKNYKSNVSYFPASIFYIPAAIGLFLPKSFHWRWTNIVILIIKKILIVLAEDKATIVVHSDALPFGRGLVMAANGVGIKSVCIQHGSFRDENIIVERDGFLCAHNIVRSAEDANIIFKSNGQTKIHILVDFFKLKINENHDRHIALNILLLGEGYHIVDKNFNEKYLAHLELIYDQLSRQGLNVIFRPHPSERSFRWKYRFYKVSSDPLQACLSQVDGIIGYSSTLLQESAEIGIPAFYVDPLGSGHQVAGRNGVTIHKFIDVQQFIEQVMREKRTGRNLGLINNQSASYDRAVDILVR